MELEYESQIINIKYNSRIDNIRLDAYVRACDEALLGRDGYRRLAAVEARLIREYQIAQRRIEITKLIMIKYESDHLILIKNLINSLYLIMKNSKTILMES